MVISFTDLVLCLGVSRHALYRMQQPQTPGKLLSETAQDVEDMRKDAAASVRGANISAVS
jgi:hypothetical protein